MRRKLTSVFAERIMRRAVVRLAYVVLLFAACVPLRADEPYARSRKYDLQHSRIVLRFDTEQKKVIGDVTHTISVFRDGTSELAFDSSGLDIESVTVDKAKAKFEVSGAKLDVTLPHAAKAGETLEVEIRYEGKPKKGLYFILPDKDYPTQPKEVWTQGESEDTHFYLPTYDYPNDRLTTETVLTVPASWITVANGKLMSVTDAGKGMKTWTWKESLPSSTYLITVVAGEFDEVKDSWRGKPVTYYAPKGKGDRLKANYERTPEMLEFFSKTLGVEYAWEKYSQAMVDDFVAGGMENSSATTNTSMSLRDPRLVPEFYTDEDGLISHELGHQWFGDLVTCKDWGDIWLNEGFATYMNYAWIEHYYPKDQAEYERWADARGWFGEQNLYEKPIVRFDFNDSSEFDGNAYTKGGWVLYMLRHQIGEENFYAGLKHYLEVNRGKNVVTADLIKAIEEATHINVDRFFNEWVYGAGAPKFDLSYAYDDAKHQVALTVKQMQKMEGRVGLFEIPVDVEITTATGPKLYPITVSKAEEVFTFPSESAPLMVLFDKGGHVLKSADFHKEKKEWLYQLKNAADFADRADAVEALGKMKEDDVADALGEASRDDKDWGIRATAADTLGEMKTPAAEKQLIETLEKQDKPWVRNRVVTALGNFKESPELAAKLTSVANNDSSWRARAAGLQALGKMKAPGALDILNAAVAGESPDGFLRNAALRAMGPLGDDKAVPTLQAWIVSGKELEARQAAISSLAQLDKTNKQITQQIAGYLFDPHFRIRISAIFALGGRGDISAVPSLEALLNSNDLSIEIAPMIKRQIARLKKGPEGKGEGAEGNEGVAAGQAGVEKRLDQLEKLMEQMNDRLKTIENRLPPKK
ncbi:MAG TPA: M1 family aminopeptidase [Candidatus Acidoferrum sp.]|nr:M1 family aminopeptidase [Candidatus Acidoferrum sp.]